MAERTLHGYWRSSASWRVRIALHWKGLDYAHQAVHLLKDGGQQRAARYRALNPMAQVPTLVLGQPGGRATPLAQSMAILEYLEEVHPEPPLMPADALSRAAARQFSEGVVSGIHPLQNLRVMRTVGAMYGVERDGQLGWARHWIMEGFEALEALAQRTAGAHVIGDAVSVADVVLVPQMYNARRFGVDLSPYPTLVRLDAAASRLAAFSETAPEGQPDAVPA